MELREKNIYFSFLSPDLLKEIFEYSKLVKCWCGEECGFSQYYPKYLLTTGYCSRINPGAFTVETYQESEWPHLIIRFEEESIVVPLGNFIQSSPKGKLHPTKIVHLKDIDILIEDGDQIIIQPAIESWKYRYHYDHAENIFTMEMSQSSSTVGSNLVSMKSMLQDGCMIS